MSKPKYIQANYTRTKGETMKAEQVLKKVKEYLQLNAEDNSHSDIQADSEHLLFWIENWENENDPA